MDIEKLIRIKTNNLSPTKGRVLISEPFMGDYYFGRSVVLLAEHNDEGSFGLIMNKQIDSSLNDIVKDFPEFDVPVYIGGPVQTDSLFFVHVLGDEIPNSSEIVKGLYWGGDIESVREMMLLHAIKPNQIRFYLGYSGWEAKQLEGELKRTSWLVSTATSHSLMHTHPDKMWDRFLRKMGADYDLWRRFPLDPHNN